MNAKQEFKAAYRLVRQMGPARCIKLGCNRMGEHAVGAVFNREYRIDGLDIFQGRLHQAKTHSAQAAMEAPDIPL